MEGSVQDGLNKRSLEETPGAGGFEVTEKRPRLESGISDISDVDVSTNIQQYQYDGGLVESSDDVVEVISVADSDVVDEQNTTEVIYELSPDNNESLLSVTVSPAQSGSVKGKDESEQEDEKVGNEQSKEVEMDDQEDIKKEQENEQGSGSEDASSSSSGEGMEEDDEDNVGIHEDSDEDAVKDSKRGNVGEQRSRGTWKKTQEDVDMTLSESESSSEDEESESERKQDKQSSADKTSRKPQAVKTRKQQGGDSDEKSSEESSDEESESEKRSDKQSSVNKTSRNNQTVKTRKKQDDSEEESSSESSNEEEVADTTTTKKKAETKQSNTQQLDVPDAGRSTADVGNSDYSTKSVEDLEYLQEDIHKELAQISAEKQVEHRSKKSKSNKAGVSTSSSSRADKRHRERSGDSGARGYHEKEPHSSWDKVGYRDQRKDVDGSRVRGRDSARERQHGTSYEQQQQQQQRRGRKAGDERRDREEKEISRSSRAGCGGGRGAAEKLQTTAVKDGGRRDGPDRARQDSGSKQDGEVRKDQGPSKAPFSDSLRELIQAGVKEIKSDASKDTRGLSTEVVDYESDQSDEDHLNLLGLNDDAEDSDSSSGSSEKETPTKPKLPPYLPAILGCRNVEEFQWLNRIEEGTYGVVYRAKEKRTGEIVALKKLKMEKEKEGFPITSLREINTLLKSQHPNIVTVQEIVVGSNMDKIYIVMDFVEHDLKALMETMTQAFLGGEIKTIMIQLLRAVNHLHDNWILHRDIKTSNLLLSNKGILKVGDFGLAREYGSPLKPYTPVVVTLWYRAPELLLGAKTYSTPIDLWSVGCVFAELLTMKPLFNGQSEISQINKIFKELGTPSDKIWPGPPAYSEYPATKKMTFAEYPYNNLRNKFGATLTDSGFDLLNSFLTYDPARRIAAEAALKHQYFRESPQPVDPSMFPSWPARSEGARRAKKSGNSPKPPEGGNFYQTLSNESDGKGAFHIPAGKSQGSTAVSGFTLKF